MIHEFEFYHGAVLTKIALGGKDSSIRSYESPSRSSYVIDGKIGLYIKHSTSRLTPWTFSFAKEHQDEIEKMEKELGDVFVALVCDKDGIACLNFKELKVVLDEVHGESEWIRVSRRPREKYTIKGSDGKLGFKVAYSDFPAKLFTIDQVTDWI
jgi:hypothetical protein